MAKISPLEQDDIARVKREIAELSTKLIALYRTRAPDAAMLALMREQGVLQARLKDLRKKG